jgi:hypothetical protein
MPPRCVGVLVGDDPLILRWPSRPPRPRAPVRAGRCLIRRRRHLPGTSTAEHRIPGVDQRPVQPAGPAGVGVRAATQPAEGCSDIILGGIPIDAEQLPRTDGIVGAVPTQAQGWRSNISVVSLTWDLTTGREEPDNSWCLASNHASYFASASLSSQCRTM